MSPGKTEKRSDFNEMFEMFFFYLIGEMTEINYVYKCDMIAIPYGR